MTLDLQEEQFSKAYIRAVAAVAGIKVLIPEIDDDSVDVQFSVKSVAGKPVSPIIDIQLKCTAVHAPKSGFIHFPLELKNYNDLRGNRVVPRYLIVMLISKKITDWINHSDQELALRKCAYWVSLENQPESSSKTRVTVKVPCSQLFAPDTLRNWFGMGAVE
jgi:hypothetical protein